MEESKKKPIMIGVIITCFVLAGVITYKYSVGPEGPSTEVFKGQSQWVKCRNSDCEAEYQMNKQVYFDSVKEIVRQSPFSMQTPPLVCKKCGKESVYRAEKCGNPKCGLVFERGAAGRGEFADKCPECGYSRSEELRKQAKGEK